MQLQAQVKFTLKRAIDTRLSIKTPYQVNGLERRQEQRKIQAILKCMNAASKQPN